MSVCDPLRRKRESVRGRTARPIFSEIEVLLGRSLPPFAYKFSAWWGNESSRKAGHTWLETGFKAKVSLRHQAVEFHRI